jgi:hypothetical protein
VPLAVIGNLQCPRVKRFGSGRSVAKSKACICGIRAQASCLYRCRRLSQYIPHGEIKWASGLTKGFAMQNPISSSSPSTKVPKSVNRLQEENARLRDLVVTLSSLVLKNVVHEFRSNVHSVASRNRKHPRSEAEEEKMAEALEAAGHELMAKAVEMKSILKRQKRHH